MITVVAPDDPDVPPLMPPDIPVLGIDHVPVFPEFTLDPVVPVTPVDPVLPIVPVVPALPVVPVVHTTPLVLVPVVEVEIVAEFELPVDPIPETITIPKLTSLSATWPDASVALILRI